VIPSIYQAPLDYLTSSALLGQSTSINAVRILRTVLFYCISPCGFLDSQAVIWTPTFSTVTHRYVLHLGQFKFKSEFGAAWTNTRPQTGQDALYFKI